MGTSLSGAAPHLGSRWSTRAHHRPVSPGLREMPLSTTALAPTPGQFCGSRGHRRRDKSVNHDGRAASGIGEYALVLWPG